MTFENARTLEAKLHYHLIVRLFGWANFRQRLFVCLFILRWIHVTSIMKNVFNVYTSQIQRMQAMGTSVQVTAHIVKWSEVNILLQIFKISLPKLSGEGVLHCLLISTW